MNGCGATGSIATSTTSAPTYTFATQAGDVDSALRIVHAVKEFSFRRMRYEVTAWADAATTLPGADGHPSFPAARGRRLRTGTSCVASSTRPCGGRSRGDGERHALGRR